LFAAETKDFYLPDNTTQVKAILARTLSELAQVIDIATIESLLSGLRSVLGLEGNGATASIKPLTTRVGSESQSR